MNAKIERGGKWVRPSFNHYRSEDGTTMHDAAAAQMLESIRNLLESCQVLQCDVAQAIKNTDRNMTALVREIRGLRRDLKAKRRRR